MVSLAFGGENERFCHLGVNSVITSMLNALLRDFFFPHSAFTSKYWVIALMAFHRRWNRIMGIQSEFLKINSGGRTKGSKVRFMFLFPWLWAQRGRGGVVPAESLSPLGYTALCFCFDHRASQTIHLTHRPINSIVKLIYVCTHEIVQKF